jgi:glycosyltransferase involved in cell wall biosynthesis
MTYHVLIVYRNFLARAENASSHIGLGVNAMHTARVLRKAGVLTDVAGVWTPEQLSTLLDGRPEITHVIIEAPWIPTAKMEAIAWRFPRVRFVLRCHSQIGFLQVEAGAVKLFLEAAKLQDGSLNFTVSGNSGRFCDFVEKTYHYDCLLLPNLYDTDRKNRRPPGFRNTNKVRIGSFGAIRLLKNHATAAAAALIIARKKRLDLEFHLSVNREEHGKGVLQMIRNMFTGLNWATLVEVPWKPWPDFRNYIGTMDLCMQLSHTETFNIVSADAASEGVPSVVSEAIDWAPRDWVAAVDNAIDAAKVGEYLLCDSEQAAEGLRTLEAYQAAGKAAWLEFLATCTACRQ